MKSWPDFLNYVRAVTPNSEFSLCGLTSFYNDNDITSDMQDVIWGEPELTMEYALLWNVLQ